MFLTVPKKTKLLMLCETAQYSQEIYKMLDLKVILLTNPSYNNFPDMHTTFLQLPVDVQAC